MSPVHRLRRPHRRLAPSARELADGIATVTLARPEKLNALTFGAYADLRDLLAELSRERSVRALVLAGEGRGFCSGGDVDEIIGATLAMDTAQLLDFNRMTGQVVRAVREVPLPGDRRRARRRRRRRRGPRPGRRLPGRRPRRPLRLPLHPGRALRRRHGRRLPAAARRRPRPRHPAADARRTGPRARGRTDRPDQRADRRGAGRRGAPPRWPAAWPTGPALAYAQTKALLTAELDMPLAAAVELDAATQALLMNGEDYAEFHAAFTEKRPARMAGPDGDEDDRTVPLRVAVVGGGPGGLYAAALLKRLDPAREMTVWERNAPDDTFGFGVVLSDETLGGIEHADPQVYAALQRRSSSAGTTSTSCTGAPPSPPAATASRPSAGAGCCRSCTSAARPSASTCAFARGPGPPPNCPPVRPGDRRRRRAQHHPRGVRATSSGPGSPPTAAATSGSPPTSPSTPSASRSPRPSTACAAARLPVRARRLAPSSWRCARRSGGPPGSTNSTSGSRPARCAKIFTDALGGRPLSSNDSTWTAFRTVVNERWSHGNIVLLGDAAHTAHFSIGSGTKLAVEDALALAACLDEHPDPRTALAAYETERRPVVASTQRAAGGQPGWFENLGHLPRPAARADSPSTCSPAAAGSPTTTCACATPRFTDAVEREFGCPPGTPPMFTPFRLRGLDPAQPRRRLAHGHVLGGGRRPRRLPPRPPRRPRPRRGRAGDDRDGVRQPRGPHHARLHRPLHRRAGRRPGVGSPTSSTNGRRGRPSASSSATPAARARRS